MTTSNLEADLIRDEGERTHAYRDSRGIWTIGIGHNIQVDPTLVPLLHHLINDGINQAQIDGLFAHDLAGAKLQLGLHLPWWTTLDDVRQDVIVNMTFNMGMKTLLQFHNTLRHIQEHNWLAASAGMLASAWATEVGGRARRLAKQMTTGIHQP